ncbi:DNRLRE domain-containing protein [Bacillus sp. ISL-75]|uniref:DNRLRE domain-containing protein n=1 Tax=Bacillus sp. ISL-75 TaxID=2819137 RepID=UPI001BE5D071|nr:DNRLRE domain-containing protein [Bacillus sp. ISL-75]MBT2730673.1 DNRLRE domain-containing protein [Bacillus sp. ISL-75]
MKLKKILALFLVFLLIFSSVPNNGRAQNGDQIAKEKDQVVGDPVTTFDLPKGEVIEKRTANSKVFYNGDGKFTKKIYFQPIHKQKKGKKEWEEISSEIVDTDNTNISTENAILNASFNKHMINGQYANFNYDNQEVTYSLLEASGEAKTISVKDVSAKYKNKSHEILYKGVFPELDLRNITFDQNSKEDLVLHSYTGYNTFTFHLATDLEAKIQPNGSIDFFVNGTEVKVYHLPKPFMTDSNYDDHSGEVSRSDDVSFDLKKVADGYILTVQADNDWLKDPKRVYPVYIDPSTSITTSTDTFVMSAYPTTNYGDSSDKWDSAQSQYVLKSGYYDSTTGTCYAFLNQSLSSLDNMIVTNADFHVYVTHSYYSTTANGLWLDTVNSSWAAGSMTWNNQPASTNISSVNVMREQWANFDVTSTVKAWVDGTKANYGFKLHTNGNGQTFWKKVVSSTNSTLKPYLSIDYTIPVPQAPTGKNYSNGNGTGYINLSWQQVDGATGYKVWIYNGKVYESFTVGNVTSWSTNNQKIWPTASEIASGRYDLHQDKLGAELSVDPSPVYKNSGGIYPTNKNYWFRVSAIFSQGESSMSDAIYPYIPNLALPAVPTGTSYSSGNGTGYIDFKWDSIAGATGYKIWIFNGSSYESKDVGNVTSWTTKGKKYWPTSTEIASGRYKLHLTDNLGTELALDPSPVYANAGTRYENYTNFWIRVSAYNAQGETINSDAYMPRITNLPVPWAPDGITYSIDDFSNYTNLTWEPISDATGYKVWIFNGKFYEAIDVGNTLNWSTKGKGIWPTESEIANATSDKNIFHTDGKGLDFPSNPSILYSKMGTSYAKNDRIYFRLSAYNHQDGETIYSNTPLITTHPRLGEEDYWTFGTHSFDEGSISVNVTNGNVVAGFSDASLYTRGVLGYRFDRVYNSLSTKKSPIGKGWTFTGNESLRAVKDSGNILSKVVYIDEDDTKHEFLYDSTTGSFISPKGKYLSLKSITINGKNGYELSDKAGFKKQFEETTPNIYRLAFYKDRFNNTIQFLYDSSNRLIKISEINESNTPIRKPITFTYIGTSNLIGAAQLVNKKYTYSYNADETLKEVMVTDVNNPANTLKNDYSYDSLGRLITVINSKGIKKEIWYGPNNVTVNEPQEGQAGLQTVYEFNIDGNQYLVAKSTGIKTFYYRDIQNDTYAIVKETNNENETKERTYDSQYNILNVNDNGVISTFTFDNQGNQLTSTDSNSNQQIKTYDTFNNLLTSKEIYKDENNQTVEELTSYTYDPSNKWQKTITNSKGTTTYEVDPYGRVTKIISPNNKTITTIYDDTTNSITEIDENNYRLVTEYNDYGAVISKTDDLGNKTRFEYDLLKPLQLNSTTQPEGGKTSYFYDQNENMTRMVDGLGRNISFIYSNMNKIKEFTIPVTSSKKMTLKYEYNDQGNLTKFTRNSLIEKRISYNDSQNIANVGIYKNDVKQLGWNYLYDENEMLSSVQFGALKKDYVYNDNKDLLTFSQGLFKQSNSYNSNNVLSSIKTEYNEATIPFNKTALYTFDEKNEMKNINIYDEQGNSQASIIMNKDDIAKTRSISVNNQISKTVQYNEENKFTSITVNQFGNEQQTRFEYDKNGNITKETTGSTVSSFVYDKNQRLVQEDLSNGTTIKYEYDNAGNRTKREILKSGFSTSTDIYVYNDANQISIRNSNPNQYSYDDDGNLLTDERYRYTYNLLGQLTKVETIDGQIVATYEYDEENQRTKKIIGNEEIEYYYQKSNLLLEVIKLDGVISGYRSYIYDNEGNPVSVIWKQKDTAGAWKESVYYFITNYRGDILKLLDESGHEVATYTYDSYGNIINSSGELADDNPIRYAGYYFDQETTHYYLNARYFNPDNGNFLNPLLPTQNDIPILINGYYYANNNPKSNIDPDGMSAYAITGDNKKYYPTTKDKEMRSLTSNVYIDKGYAPVGTYVNGWRVYKNITGNASFQARIYKKQLSNGKSDFCIAYKGTKEKRDVLVDINEVVLGRKGAQTKQALYVVSDLWKNEKKNINKLFFTGHSLGGYLAQYIESDIVDKNLSVSVPNKAYTFNAPGVEHIRKMINDKKYMYDSSITNYMIFGDPISTLTGDNLGIVKIFMPKKVYYNNLEFHKLVRFEEIGFY